MASTIARATWRPTSRPARRSRQRANIAGITLVAVFAPVVAVIASAADFLTIAALAAVIALLLIVLWSAEATFYVLIFSMLLSPEFIVGGLAGTGAMAERGITLRLDDYVIVIIGLAWLIRLAVYKEAAVFRRTPLNGPIVAYLGFAALVTLLGAAAGRVQILTGSFYVLKGLEYTVIYFLVVNYVRDRDQIRRLLSAVLVTAIVIAIVGIVQIPLGGRITAPFEGEQGEPNTLGGYLVLMLAFSLAFLGEARNKAQRAMGALATGLMLVPLAFTYSRTSWIAFCAMLVATIALSRRKAIFFLLITALTVIMIVSPPEGVIERATYTLSSQRNSIEFLGYTIEPSAAARLEAWSIAAAALSQYPFGGAGVTGFGLIDAQYPRTLAETGLIGFALFIWLLARILGTGFQLRRVATTHLERILANGFVAGFIGMLAHGIGANTFIIVRIMEPTWLLAGLVGAALLLRQAEDSSVEGAPAPINARLSAPQLAR